MTTKSTVQALENVFAAEIEDRLPFQSKAAIYKQLLEQGLVQNMEHVVGSGWSAVTVRGYQLTHAGRLMYCLSCTDPGEQPISPSPTETAGSR